MKIAFVIPNFNCGGAQVVAVALARYFDSTNFDVTIIAFKSFGPLRSQIPSHIRIIVLNSRTLFAFPLLFLHCRKLCPDFLISCIRDTNIVAGLLIPFFSRTRFIFREANTFDSLRKYSFVNFVYLFLIKALYPLSYRVVCNSNDTLSDLLSLFSPVVPRNFKVIGNPLSLSDISIERQGLSDVPTSWVRSGCRIMLNIGRLEYQKNHFDLLHIFSRLHSHEPDLRLLIVGSGSYYNAIISLAKDLNILSFIHIISYTSDVRSLFQASHLYLHTAHYEGFGNVLLEAMYYKVPIVSYLCRGGPRMFNQNNTNLLTVTPGDVSSYVLSVLDLLHNTTLYSKLQKNAYNESLNYSVSAIAERYIESL